MLPWIEMGWKNQIIFRLGCKSDHFRVSGMLQESVLGHVFTIYNNDLDAVNKFC